jgi:hypothetical protein
LRRSENGLCFAGRRHRHQVVGGALVGGGELEHCGGYVRREYPWPVRSTRARWRWSAACRFAVRFAMTPRSRPGLRRATIRAGGHG